MREITLSISGAFIVNQRGGKKGKDKNKDMMVLVNERLVEINTSISTLTGSIKDMDKPIEELESKGDMEELSVKMQAAMNSIVADINKEIQTFCASKDGKLQACKAEVEAFKAKVGDCKAEVEARS